MAKFCSNCGFRMEDDDKVCGNCGTPVAVVGGTPKTVIPQSGKKFSVPKIDLKDPKVKKIIIIAAIAVVAIAVVIGGISIIKSLNGYQRVLDKCAKAIQKNDAETIVAQLSSIYSENREEEWLINWIEEELDDILDAAEDKVGTIKSVSIEVDEEKDVTERKVNKFKEYMEDHFDLDMRDIKSIKEIKYRIVVNGSKSTYRTKYTTGYLFKESGGWKIYLDTLYQ